MADLQIGVEDRSQPVPTFIGEEGYGDLEIARGSSCNLEIAFSDSAAF